MSHHPQSAIFCVGYCRLNFVSTSTNL